ncbi:MAG: hypothetical protein DMG98_06215 [Acidobacteria bacterium]|nr:MAG: hypothetical protein DMG98_06215 [Acidobacteriota bacterium]
MRLGWEFLLDGAALIRAMRESEFQLDVRNIPYWAIRMQPAAQAVGFRMGNGQAPKGRQSHIFPARVRPIY